MSNTIRDARDLPPTKGHWHVCRCGTELECLVSQDQCPWPEPFICYNCRAAGVVAPRSVMPTDPILTAAHLAELHRDRQEMDASAAFAKAHRTTNVLIAVENELRRAMGKHPEFNSAHEGYAVILEELDELWTEVMKREKSSHALREEAIQVAAMAIRFVIDITG